jgi:hypothetical protein
MKSHNIDIKIQPLTAFASEFQKTMKPARGAPMAVSQQQGCA